MKTESLQQHSASTGQRLLWFLEVAGWNRTRLAEEINNHNKLFGRDDTLTPAIVSAWCTDRRSPSRTNLLRIAEVLSLHFEKIKAFQKGNELEGWDLGSLVGNLLQVAGHQIERVPTNVIWNRIRDCGLSGKVPEINVGWAECPPFASENDGERICLDIASHCVASLDAQFRPRRYEWDELSVALVQGEIDIVAPILAVSPHRMQSVSFTTSLGLLIGHKCILMKNLASDGLERDQLIKGEIQSATRLIAIRVRSEIGGLLSRLSADELVPYGKDADNLPEAIGMMRNISAEITSQSERLPCVIAESIRAEKIVRDNLDLVALDPPPNLQLRFPIAFGIHPREERLVAALNSVIEGLKHSGAMFRWIKTYEQKLGDNVWIDRTVPAEPPTVASWVELKKGK